MAFLRSVFGVGFLYLASYVAVELLCQYWRWYPDTTLSYTKNIGMKSVFQHQSLLWKQQCKVIKSYLPVDFPSRNFFFFLPKSSYSSLSESWELYSTLPLSSKPPPRPVLSSTSPTLGALQTKEIDEYEISQMFYFET